MTVVLRTSPKANAMRMDAAGTIRNWVLSGALIVSTFLRAISGGLRVSTHLRVRKIARAISGALIVKIYNLVFILFFKP